jgi:signal recognition particle subunit SRP54
LRKIDTSDTLSSVILGKLSQALREVCKQCCGAKRTTKSRAKMRSDIFRSLVGADVSVEVAKDFSAEVVKSLDLCLEEPAEEVFCRILQVALGDGMNIPSIGKLVFVVGLNGAGKTTTACKLAKSLSDSGLSVSVAPCDLSRPGAVEQVFSTCDRIGVPVIRPEGSCASDVLKNALACAGSYDCVIFDLAGRQEAEEELVKELHQLWKIANPDTILYVADGAGGQQMAEAGRVFAETVPIDGIVLTKLDGDAVGGGAVSLVHTIGAPIILVGTGEKMEDLEPFSPSRMAKRIMGQPDLVALMDSLDEADWQEEGNPDNMNLEDFLRQMRAIRKVGSISRLAEMAGWGHSRHNCRQEEPFRKMEAIVFSMNREERSNPEILYQAGRMERVSYGAGVGEEDVKEFLGRFFYMKKLLAGS